MFGNYCERGRTRTFNQWLKRTISDLRSFHPMACKIWPCPLDSYEYKYILKSLFQEHSKLLNGIRQQYQLSVYCLVRSSDSGENAFWQSFYEGSSTHRPVEVEKREYPARCSQTRKRFNILMARKKDSTGPFRVVSLKPIDELDTHQLPSPNDRISFLNKLFNKKSDQDYVDDRSKDFAEVSDQDLESMFDETLVLDFGDIDWAGFQCPYCEDLFTHPDGTLSSWTICGKCSRVSCAGGIRKTSFGGYSTCPWCGSVRQITYHVPTGKKAQKSVRGLVSRQQIKRQQRMTELPRKSKDQNLPPPKEDVEDNS
jgi:hypothetical protein